MPACFLDTNILLRHHLTRDALDLFVSQNLPFVDAYNAVFICSLGLSGIYSWDGDFDKIAGIHRLEPWMEP